MKTDQEYILAENAAFAPAASLDEQLQKQLGCNVTDVVLTLHHSRAGTTLLDSEAAALLKQFQTPQTLATAIVQYAKLTCQDPQLLAEQAFSFLVKMQADGYLVPYSETPTGPSGTFPAGLQIGSYTISAACQVMEDSAVYKVLNANGEYFALKIFHRSDNTNVANACAEEVAVLKSLDGTFNPAWVETDSFEGLPYFVMEWCDGVSCDRAAAPFRNFNIRQNMLALMDLCLSIAKAYSHLHSQGVLHGDVNPNNILVAADGKVKLVDYGFSSRVGQLQSVARGGVGYYYEPELAAAVLRGEKPPPPTKEGELYALAALLYQVFTGHFYLPFAPDSATVYQQIIDNKPEPFIAHDVPVPPSLLVAFEKALAKSPADRFVSVNDFAAALEQSRREISETPFYFTTGKISATENWTAFLFRKYGWEGKLLKNGLSFAPTCSVNFGAAGVAYLFYRAACVQEDPDLMAIANVWANRASLYGTNHEKAFYNAGEELTKETVGLRSLYHSPTGVHLILGLVSAGSNNRYLLHQSVQNFMAAAAITCPKTDLTLGKAGLLVGAALLFRELNTNPGPDRSALVVFTNQLLNELWSELDTYADLGQPNPVGYYGIAHGWAGILYATLLWCRTSGTVLPAQFGRRTEELLGQAIQRDGALQWPLSPTEPQHWTGWCHGNAGYVFLWSLMYLHTGEQRFLETAEKTALPLLQNRKEVLHLCCGLAGQAYALNNLFRITGNSLYEKRVHRLREMIIAGIGSPELRNNSLYKGEVGIGVLLCELSRSETARMPLFE